MYNKKEEAMRKEARAAIIETLKNGYSGYYCDLHNEVFNTHYYIIGAHEAKEALKEYDVFKAVEKVQKYEIDNFEILNYNPIGKYKFDIFHFKFNRWFT